MLLAVDDRDRRVPSTAAVRSASLATGMSPRARRAPAPPATPRPSRSKRATARRRTGRSAPSRPRDRAPRSSRRHRAPPPAAGSPPGRPGRAPARTRSHADRGPARPSPRRCRTPSARTAPRRPGRARRSPGSRRGRPAPRPRRSRPASRAVSGVAADLVLQRTDRLAVVLPTSASSSTSGCSDGEDEERHSPQRVGARREDLDLLARLVDPEANGRRPRTDRSSSAAS